MKIYFVKHIDTLGEDFIKLCSSFFPQWRKDKMLGYKLLNAQIQSALAYVLLIYALRDNNVLNELPIFEYNEHDKPFMVNYPEWHFNISHSKTAVACVLSKKNVGIDIQEVATYKESLARYISNEKEFLALQNTEDQADEFYKLWTRKEAAFKLIGSGITKEINNILDNKDISVISEKTENIWISLAYYND